jgi:hypothetical protein
MPGIDQYTMLCLHCDGADAATTFVDAAGRHSPSAAGHAQVDTAHSVFGGGSALFDGNGDDWIEIADSDDWFFSTNDLTIDFRVRMDDIGSTRGFWTQYISASNHSYGMWDQSTETLNYIVVASGATVIAVRGEWTPSADAWYHVALIRHDSDDWLWTVDGVPCVMTGTPDASAVPNIGGVLKLGATNNYFLHGWLDEFRISKGLARWTTNFTPPTAHYDTPRLAGGYSRVAKQVEEIPPDAIVW